MTEALGRYSKIIIHAKGLITSMEAFVESKENGEDAVRSSLSLIWLNLSKLYNAFVDFTLHGRQLLKPHSKEKLIVAVRSPFTSEREMRRLLTAKLENAGLLGLNVDEEFLRSSEICTSQDLVSSLRHHLIDIYVECCSMLDELSRGDSKKEVDLDGFYVRVQHLTRHHIPFVLYPIEWVCDPDSWIGRDHSLEIQS